MGKGAQAEAEDRVDVEVDPKAGAQRRVKRMIDRDTVIEALQHLISGECTDTQFDYLDEIEAAIALLKEQGTTNTGEARIFKCEKCGYGFDDIFLIDERNYDMEPNYCPNCGRSVK